VETPSAILALSGVIICCLLFVFITKIPDIHPNFLKRNQRILAARQQFGHPCMALPPCVGPISLWLQIAATVAKKNAASQSSGIKHGSVLGCGKTTQRNSSTWARVLLVKLLVTCVFKKLPHFTSGTCPFSQQRITA
jgi:hypothetical protein